MAIFNKFHKVMLWQITQGRAECNLSFSLHRKWNLFQNFTPGHAMTNLHPDVVAKACGLIKSLCPVGWGIYNYKLLSL